MYNTSKIIHHFCLKLINMKFCKILFGFFLLILFTGCDDFFKLPDHSTGAEDMDHLYVSSEFSWSTAQLVTVNITGLPAMKNISLTKYTLIIYDNDEVYYKGLHGMDENLQLSLSISAEVKNLKLKLGGLVLESEIKDKQAYFSFIPNN